MKKIVVLVAVLFLLPLSLIADNKSVLPEAKVPVAIKNYITKNFPGDAILQTVKDIEVDWTYDVYLKSGVQLEFSRKKEILKVEAARNGATYGCLPQSVIPSEIWNYVAKNYPNNCISKWEFDREGLRKYQNVELNNDLDLVFDANGNFYMIDFD